MAYKNSSILNPIIASIFLCFFMFNATNAQIGINNSGAPADPSALLDLESTSKGFLTPRMTEAQRDAISNPATSLLIYQTDGVKGFYSNLGTPAAPAWVRIGNQEANSQIKNTRIPIDSVAINGSYGGYQTLYAITEPGSYYLTKNIYLSESGLNNSIRQGIAIFVSNVTIDLNGFMIFGAKGGYSNPSPAVGQSNAIIAVGFPENITIKNGSILNWTGHGIAFNFTTQSIIQNIHVSNVNGNGFFSGSNTVHKECSAFQCGDSGFRGFSSSHYLQCRSSYNEENGFDVDSYCQIIDCTIYRNDEDGIDAGDRALVLGCNVSENDGHGIIANFSSNIISCLVQNNDEDGIEISNDCLVQSCITSVNKGHGINQTGTGGSRIVENLCYENDFSGIYCSASASDVVIQRNRILDNDDIGVFVEGDDCFITQNVASGNLDNASNNGGATYDDHFEISSGSSYGPIINAVNYGDIGNITNSDHPFANFIY